MVANSGQSGNKIRACDLTETKMNFSISFQSLQTLELNRKQTTILSLRALRKALKHFIQEKAVRDVVSKG